MWAGPAYQAALLLELESLQTELHACLSGDMALAARENQYEYTQNPHLELTSGLRWTGPHSEGVTTSPSALATAPHVLPVATLLLPYWYPHLSFKGQGLS